MSRPQFPEAVYRLKSDEPFNFACHPGVPCFTDCCKMLELALTPYDVLRMRRGTGLTSQQLHDQYIIEERGEQDMFPKYYLTMIDDGQASCAFVDKEKGCAIYSHRPGACRAYPLGRAAVRTRSGELHQHFVLMKESHCKGFAESVEQTPEKYSQDQDLVSYNRFNDAIATLIQHDKIRQGLFMPNDEQLRLYTLALYNIDVFRAQVHAGTLNIGEVPSSVLDNNEELLLFAIDWLKDLYFKS